MCEFWLELDFTDQLDPLLTVVISEDEKYPFKKLSEIPKVSHDNLISVYDDLSGSYFKTRVVGSPAIHFIDGECEYSVQCDYGNWSAAFFNFESGRWEVMDGCHNFYQLFDEITQRWVPTESDAE